MLSKLFAFDEELCDSRIFEVDAYDLLRSRNREANTEIVSLFKPDVIRFRKLSQPFRPGAVEEDAIRAVAVAGRPGSRIGCVPAQSRKPQLRNI